MSAGDWLRFGRGVGVVLGTAFAVMFLPQASWATDVPSPTSTQAPSSTDSPSATDSPSTSPATETTTTTATATETVTATPTETPSTPPAPTPLDGDQFTAIMVGLGLVVVSGAVVAGWAVSRG